LTLEKEKTNTELKMVSLKRLISEEDQESFQQSINDPPNPAQNSRNRRGANRRLKLLNTIMNIRCIILSLVNPIIGSANTMQDLIS
jgi:hypothetical protein